jgi:hypothetical protein
MSRADPQVAVRLPPDVKAFIQAEARENASSQNSEIVRAIRERMKAKGSASVGALPSRGSSQTHEGKANELIKE